VTEDLPHLSSRREPLISGIDLQLDAEVRTGSRQVHRRLEALDANRWPEQRPEALELAGGEREIEVEAHDRLGVRVDRLTADHAVVGAGLLKDLKRLLEEIRVIQGHRFPEGRRLHGKALSSL